VDGHNYVWSPGARSHHFEGAVRFGAGPVSHLDGEVDLRATRHGWRLSWRTDAPGWVAAASVGELGEDAPFEAKRALAAVLARWLPGHGHQHPGGVLCPLTHCAVIRGSAEAETRRAAATAPALATPARWLFFTGSTGGVRLSPKEVWGQGPDAPLPSRAVDGDRWAAWTRSLSAAQVAYLKRAVRPGLAPGQRGLRLGPSGPYAIEALRIACGRRFGWTLWPSNACEAEPLPDGGVALRGHGWGHNVGLDLALAVDEAKHGAKAEAILREAFGDAAVSSAER
jgi:hypothetical protein